MAALLTIGATEVAQRLTDYTVVLSDLDSDNSNRDEVGYMHRDRLRQAVRKVQVKLTHIPLSRTSEVLQSVKPDKVNVHYLDPQEGGYITAEMYVGDRTCVLSKHTDLDDPEESRWDVSFNLTQY